MKIAQDIGESSFLNALKVYSICRCVCVCDRAESQFFDPTAHSVSDPEEEILIIYYTIISLFYIEFQSKVYMDWYNYIKPVWDFNYFP